MFDGLNFHCLANVILWGNLRRRLSYAKFLSNFKRGAPENIMTGNITGRVCAPNPATVWYAAAIWQEMVPCHQTVETLETWILHDILRPNVILKVNGSPKFLKGTWMFAPDVMAWSSNQDQVCHRCDATSMSKKKKKRLVRSYAAFLYSHFSLISASL